ncbi:MAG TPA: hypothetical protein VNN75_08655 [Stellaceae bacterium]|jgi:hypothetical protein|nr:hypothetical protein [Stellaceae bacterium]
MGRSSWRAPGSGTLDLLERRSWHHSHRIPRRAEPRDENLVEISWDEFFKKFDEANLALVYEEETASGEPSYFYKIIGRETAEAREDGETHASRHHGRR